MASVLARHVRGSTAAHVRTLQYRANWCIYTVRMVRLSFGVFAVMEKGWGPKRGGELST